MHSADYFPVFYRGDLKNVKSALIWAVYLVLDGRNASRNDTLTGLRLIVSVCLVQAVICCSFV